ncbi:MAG TPA: exosortase [Nitrospiria bacterium]|jgi:exosortase
MTILLIWLFYPLGGALFFEWRSDPEFSHGFLIPIVSVYLIWIHREKIASLLYEYENNKTSSLSVLYLFSGLSLFIWGKFLDQIFIEGIGMVTILLGIIYVLYGFTMLKALLFPISYLVFMLPIPYFINYFVANQLKFFIAGSSSFILGLAQIPVFLEGHVIHLSSLSLEIVEACSGMQTIISFLAISSVFAYLGYHSNYIRTLFILLAIPLAIAANILRISAIGFISYYFNNDIADGFHGYAWTFVILIGIVGFFAIDRVIKKCFFYVPLKFSLKGQ